MAERFYTREHLWLAVDAEGNVRVGVTEYAQDELGDVVFVDLPDVGREGAAGDDVAVVESVKTASDIALPLAGTIVAVNEELADAPETVNSSPESDGWLFDMVPSEPIEPDDFMIASDYDDYVAALRD